MLRYIASRLPTPSLRAPKVLPTTGQPSPEGVRAGGAVGVARAPTASRRSVYSSPWSASTAECSIREPRMCLNHSLHDNCLFIVAPVIAHINRCCRSSKTLNTVEAVKASVGFALRLWTFRNQCRLMKFQ
jgi:hypothetical protein